MVLSQVPDQAAFYQETEAKVDALSNPGIRSQNPDHFRILISDLLAL